MAPRTEPATEIPQVEPPSIDGKATGEAANTFDVVGQKLDIDVKRWAAYGALVVAALLYVSGLYLICKVLVAPADCATTSSVTATTVLLKSCPGPMEKEAWHGFLGALVALSSVPTVLLITVLRAVANGKKDKEADNVYTAIGEKLVSLIENFGKSKG